MKTVCIVALGVAPLALQGCGGSATSTTPVPSPITTAPSPITPAPSPSTPAPFAALGCPKATNIDPSSNWLFETVPWHHSSNCDVPVYHGTGDVAKICVDENGQPDYTSIFVDMTAYPSTNRTGCFQWKMTDCVISDLRKVKRIEFDIDIQGCEDVWAAPLWMYPAHWTAPGQTSGEIDMAEFCPLGKVNTNFAGAGQPGEFQVSWADASSLGGPKHYTMSFNSTIPGGGGTLNTTICNLAGKKCVQGGYYENFLDTVTSTKGTNSAPYTFSADVWNGFGGDGWSSCHAKNSPDTKCNYAVRNIRVHPSDGKPIFEGKCAKLNPSPTELVSV